MSDVDISEVVDSTVTVEDNFPSRRGFGTPLLLAYHNRQANDDRVLSYTRLGEAEEDWPLDHPIYLALAAAFSQNPRPEVVKVGRRAGAPTQTIRLTPTRTTGGFPYRFSIGGVPIEVTVTPGDAVEDVCDDLVAAIGASALAADDDAILAALATADALQTITSQANGVIGRGTISPPAKLTVTRSAHSDQDEVSAILTYVDDVGITREQTLAFANGGNDSFASTYRASRFVSLSIPAQSGAGGTTKIGIAARAAATDGTTHVDVAVSDAGAWLPFRFTTKRVDLLVEDRTANPGTTIQTDLAAVQAADSDWYGLTLVDAQSSAQILAAAEWCLGNQKLLVFDTFDSGVVDPTSTTDVAAAAKDAGYFAAGFYHRNGNGQFPSARLQGRHLPKTPGTETWALHTLDGLTTDDLTASERTALNAKNMNFYARMAGKGRLLGTKNGGILSSGRFIDLERFRVSLNSEIQEENLAVMTNSDKVPMDNFGLVKLGAAIRVVCKRKETLGALRRGSTIITVPDVDDIPIADRGDRIASGLEWDAIYTGATHKARIRGRLGV